MVYPPVTSECLPVYDLANSKPRFIQMASDKIESKDNASSHPHEGSAYHSCFQDAYDIARAHPVPVGVATIAAGVVLSKFGGQAIGRATGLFERTSPELVAEAEALELGTRTKF